jgi:hypothetical protein
MIWSTGSIEEGSPRLWHCLGCGREFLVDAKMQELDDRLREQVARGGRLRDERHY